MLAREKINELARRKEMLLTQSQAHRLLIQLELQNLQSSLPWLSGDEKPAEGLFSRYRWLLTAASLLLAKRGGGSLFQWIIRGIQAWSLFRGLKR